LQIQISNCIFLLRIRNFQLIDLLYQFLALTRP
jgi:hypothetical protein